MSPQLTRSRSHHLSPTSPHPCKGTSSKCPGDATRGLSAHPRSHLLSLARYCRFRLGLATLR
ncbi:hypothetical protein BDR07DRAFT_1404909 [Suillus spraguei]|nr:hypothetical protein BDR07DRAFT_1404909 [Suillus spraguei]